MPSIKGLWNLKLSPCMSISDEIDEAAITIDETTILEVKEMIWPRRYFQKSSFNIKILFSKSSCDNWMLVFIEDEFSIIILSLDMCQFPSENGFQIPVTLRGKTIFGIQTTILSKNRQFHEKSATKSASAGTHLEAENSNWNIFKVFKIRVGIPCSVGGGGGGGIWNLGPPKCDFQHFGH